MSIEQVIHDRPHTRDLKGKAGTAEVGARQEFPDLLQPEPPLPVKQDLLQRQKLRLLVKPVAIGANMRWFQQARFIVKMKRALSEFVVEGVKTTIPFHLQLMKNEAFRKGDFNTKFLETFQLQ